MNDLILPLEVIENRYVNSIFKEHDRKKQIDLCWIFETFHLGNIIESNIDFSSLFNQVEQKLCKYGATMILLTIPESLIQERSILTTRALRNSGWSSYLKNLSNDDTELTKIFKDRQDKLICFCKNSKIPYKIIDTANPNWISMANEISKFSFGEDV